MSHYWTFAYGIDDIDKPRKEQDFRWRSFCGQAVGGPDEVEDAPFAKPFPKRAGMCYACYHFAKDD